MGLAAEKIESEYTSALEQLQNLLFVLGRISGDQIVSAVKSDIENEYPLNDLFLLRYLTRNSLVNGKHLEALSNLIHHALIACPVEKSDLILSYARGLSIVGTELRRG